MSSGLVWEESYYSPYTDLISLEVPQPIFYAHPTDATDPDPDIYPNPSGWGYPFKNEDGIVLPTGTKGGPDQIKMLVKNGVNWSMQSKPGGHLYGNIDWRGPIVNTSDEGVETRLRLTWNGPQMRYFPDDSYDYSVDAAFQVYYKGRIIAVTPNPVLGAGAKEEVDPDTDTDNLVWMLYVMCKDGLNDVLYKYRMDATGWSAGTITEAIADNLRSPYDKVENPMGYTIYYTIPRQSHHGTPGHEIDDEALEARTPWFFNESCTKLVCMREVESTYTDDSDVEYTEPGLSKYILDLANHPDFLYGGNLPRMRWKETHDFNRYLDWGNGDAEVWQLWPYDRADPTYDINVLHPYIRFKLEQTLSGSGMQSVATDFDGDLMITANIKVDSDRSQRQEFSQGVDCNADYGLWDVSCDTNMQNNNEPCGRQPGTGFEFLNGDGAARISGSHSMLLEFGNSGGKHEFTVVWDVYGEDDALEGGGVDPTVPNIIEFHGYNKRFMHFMDLRHPYTMVYSEIVAKQWISPDDVKTQVFHKEAYAINTNESEYISSTTLKDEVIPGNALGYAWEAGVDPTKAIIGGPDWDFSADIVYQQSTDAGVTYQFTTEFINSGWGDGVDLRSADAADIDPPYINFWEEYSTMNPNKWYSWTIFFGNSYYDAILDSFLYLNQVTGGMAKVEADWVFSYKEPNLYTGVPSEVIHNYLNGADAVSTVEIVKPNSTVPGVNVDIKSLYPLGVI